MGYFICWETVLHSQKQMYACSALHTDSKNILQLRGPVRVMYTTMLTNSLEKVPYMWAGNILENSNTLL